MGMGAACRRRIDGSTTYACPILRSGLGGARLSPCYASAPTDSELGQREGAPSASSPQQPTLAKGDFVRGTVAAVDARGATLELQGGASGSLSWRNFSKTEKHFDDPVFWEKLLSPGDAVWACVMDTPKQQVAHA